MAEAILVVDDNEANARLMSVLLRSAGYDVESARNAVEARAAFERRCPHLIIMDIQMPETDGLSLTREFKRHPGMREIPIVAVTAATLIGDEERALASGCESYVAKPINTRAFAETIRGVFASRKDQGPRTA